jgi:tRNA-dihydrouridine synthase B
MHYPMKIGDLEIKEKLFLAPMSNVTNLPFRLLCKRYGAAMVYSEMINADAFLRQSPKTGKRIYFVEEERPIGVQLFGSDEKILIMAAKKIEKELRSDLIDINIGCPAYDVMKTGGGASLLKDEKKLQMLISSLSNAISIPLTCKIRITKDDEKILKIAKIIEKSGAKALTVHGRTARQKYSGKANWDIIKKIKANAKIPIILNGDVIDELSAEKAFSYTKCDAVMIGRAAIGNPYLFKRINYCLKTKKMLEKQTLKQKTEDFYEYVRLCRKHNYTSISSIKTQAHNFMKGFEGAKTIRQKISRSKTISEIINLLGA